MRARSAIGAQSRVRCPTQTHREQRRRRQQRLHMRATERSNLLSTFARSRVRGAILLSLSSSSLSLPRSLSLSFIGACEREYSRSERAAESARKSASRVAREPPPLLFFAKFRCIRCGCRRNPKASLCVRSHEFIGPKRIIRGSRYAAPAKSQPPRISLRIFFGCRA